MAVTNKTFLDLAGLTLYDGKIKDWSNSASQVAYKSVLKSADGNSLNFYVKPNATLEDTADATIALGNADTEAKLNALASIVAASYDSENKIYSITGLNTDAKNTLVAAINELLADIGDVDDLNTTAKTLVGAVNELKTAIADLDAPEFALATVSNNVVTIKGIKEEDGVIAVGTDTTKDVVFEEVAMTGAAADVSIADAGELITATTVEAALQEAFTAINANDDAAKVTVEVSDGASGSDTLKSYAFYQGVLASDDAAAKAAKLLTTVNIPKDYLVKSAEVKTVTAENEPYAGAKVGDKYIDFTVNTKDGDGTGTATHLYVAINDLIHPISGSVGSEVTVTVSATNEIGATINTIDGAKIVYKAETSEGAGDGETVKAALTRLDGNDTTTGSVSKKIKDAIDTLDTTADVALVTYAAGSEGAADVITLTGSMSETNGVIATGSADGVTLSTITNAQINGLFS